ncbi:hypothetical protein LOD99_15459 [Oopsacas minuta]|uniref:Uncharacterized protein n=1 Tax=Oopsacas minuta TaxID=111878 RepID=A0AAV7KB92_9METZ|nr:hypothetical protein LOD99_15459 [Oopsacas minuta]
MFRCTSGLNSLEAQEAVISLEFHNIQLIHNAKIVPIDKMKFLEILIKRMNDRLFITTFSRSPTATGESTAECERGVGHMNIIIVDRRASLLVSHVSSLLFIKLNGPPLSSWNPSHYALSWLRHQRGALDTRIKRKPLTLEENPVWKYF